jgi:hypothetical protein
MAGPEFGSEAGKPMPVKKALCHLKSCGAAFRACSAERTLDAMGCRPSSRPAVKPDGFECHECVLCHVDDVPCMSHHPLHHPEKSMKRMQQGFKLKDDKIEEPDTCLGATLSKMKIDNSKLLRWTVLPEQLMKATVMNVEEDLAKNGKRPPPSKCVTPFSSNHAPWSEDSPEGRRDWMS